MSESHTCLVGPWRGHGVMWARCGYGAVWARCDVGMVRCGYGAMWAWCGHGVGVCIISPSAPVLDAAGGAIGGAVARAVTEVDLVDEHVGRDGLEGLCTRLGLGLG